MTGAQTIERNRRRTAHPAFAAAMLVLAACSNAGSEGRCLYRQTYGSDLGGQLRWGPCNNQNPSMYRLFGGDEGSGPR